MSAAALTSVLEVRPSLSIAFHFLFCCLRGLGFQPCTKGIDSEGPLLEAWLELGGLGEASDDRGMQRGSACRAREHLAFQSLTPSARSATHAQFQGKVLWLLEE